MINEDLIDLHLSITLLSESDICIALYFRVLFFKLKLSCFLNVRGPPIDGGGQRDLKLKWTVEYPFSSLIDFSIQPVQFQRDVHRILNRFSVRPKLELRNRIELSLSLFLSSFPNFLKVSSLSISFSSSPPTPTPPTSPLFQPLLFLLNLSYVPVRTRSRL